MNNSTVLNAKTALVTGGARRIGAAIVSQLHHAGYQVLIHCHHSTTEAQLLANLLNTKRNDSARITAINLHAPNAVSTIMHSILNWSGRLDVLINNASVFTRTPTETTPDSEWNSLFDLNVKIPYQLSMGFQPFLAQHQGSIINITDIHAQKPLVGYSVYCQTKAALEMQTKSLAREFAPAIRVNAIAPGAIVWPENSNSLSSEQQHKIVAQTPLQQHGNPSYIASAVLALVENPFISGQILNVDGGRSIT